jgi:hypothetical protein
MEAPGDAVVGVDTATGEGASEAVVGLDGVIEEICITEGPALVQLKKQGRCHQEITKREGPVVLHRKKHLKKSRRDRICINVSECV